MTQWTDRNSHLWSTPEPLPADTCHRCGLPFSRSTEFTCADFANLSPDDRLAMLRSSFSQAVAVTHEQAAMGLSNVRTDQVRLPAYTDEVIPDYHISIVNMEAKQAAWDRTEKLIRQMFEEDLAVMRDRALEYGSDLDIQGKANESLLPGRDRLTSEQARMAGMEMAVAGYLMGKAARLYGSWENGMFPRPDSYRDQSNFGYIARVIRATGGWLR